MSVGTLPIETLEVRVLERPLSEPAPVSFSLSARRAPVARDPAQPRREAVEECRDVVVGDPARRTTVTVADRHGALGRRAGRPLNAALMAVR
ncbi:MAG: hypothetical protein JOZ07_13605 [Solirubrobacterales bacterium]|nr:hypothetical protein [Solirubrobacterales bacterium]